MNINVNKSDIIWGYLGVVVSIGSNLIIIPMVMYFLSGKMLGIWYIFMSIGGIAGLFDFGFSPTFARNIAYCWSGVNKLKRQNIEETINGDPNYQLLKDVMITCKRIYAVLATSLLLLLISVGTFYIEYITSEIDENIHIIAWFIFALGTFLNLYYNYYDTFLRGVGAISQANKCKIIAKFIQLFLILLLLSSGLGIIGVTIGYIAYGISFRILANYYFTHYKGIGKKIRNIKSNPDILQSKELFKIVWFSAWREGVVQFCLYCGEQLSVIIGSFYLTLEETGTYSLGLQVANAISTIASTSYINYQPALQNAFVIKDWNKIRNIMSAIITTLVLLFMLGGIAAIFVALPILKIIKPSAIISIPIFCGIYANQFILKFRNCYSSYFSCSNRLIYIKAYVISAFLCIFLSLFLFEFFDLGVWSLIYAQIFSQVVFNAWYWPIKGNRDMQISFATMFKQSCQNFRKQIFI